eukprot:1356419-Pyramimonas_sp.AAC.1
MAQDSLRQPISEHGSRSPPKRPQENWQLILDGPLRVLFFRSRPPAKRAGIRKAIQAFRCKGLALRLLACYFFWKG